MEAMVREEKLEDESTAGGKTTPRVCVVTRSGKRHGPQDEDEHARQGDHDGGVSGGTEPQRDDSDGASEGQGEKIEGDHSLSVDDAISVGDQSVEEGGGQPSHSTPPTDVGSSKDEDWSKAHAKCPYWKKV